MLIGFYGLLGGDRLEVTHFKFVFLCDMELCFVGVHSAALLFRGLLGVCGFGLLFCEVWMGKMGWLMWNRIGTHLLRCPFLFRFHGFGRDVSIGSSPLYWATSLNPGSFSELLSDFWRLLMLCGMKMKLAIDSLAMKAMVGRVAPSPGSFLHWWSHFLLVTTCEFEFCVCDHGEKLADPLRNAMVCGGRYPANSVLHFSHLFYHLDGVNNPTARCRQNAFALLTASP